MPERARPPRRHRIYSNFAVPPTEQAHAESTGGQSQQGISRGLGHDLKLRDLTVHRATGKFGALRDSRDVHRVS